MVRRKNCQQVTSLITVLLERILDYSISAQFYAFFASVDQCGQTVSHDVHTMAYACLCLHNGVLYFRISDTQIKELKVMLCFYLLIKQPGL